MNHQIIQDNKDNILSCIRFYLLLLLKDSRQDGNLSLEIEGIEGLPANT